MELMKSSDDKDFGILIGSHVDFGDHINHIVNLSIRQIVNWV